MAFHSHPGPLALAVAGLVAAMVFVPIPARAAEGPDALHGLASFYGHDLDGLPTASGEQFDMLGMTAAHRSLPFGTRVRVTNLSNGRSTIVRINDRGPFVKGRILDLSYAAAQRLHMVGCGVRPVRIVVLQRPRVAARANGGPAERLAHRRCHGRGELLAVRFRSAGVDALGVNPALPGSSPDGVS
jgi:rare lipoprotein A (peptidoglycan hydrolase)